MPELPDLEVFKRYVDSTSLHQNIETIEVKDGRVLGGVSAGELKRGLQGRTFESTRRYGKHLFVELDNDRSLLLHFGMTGDLKYYKDVAEEPTHARVLISFRNGYRLAFDDQRLFGKVDLIEDPDAFIEEHKLGLDPLDLAFPAFRERLEGRRGEIKATLMNQRIFAGIGNIYSDEILFQVSASIPERACGYWMEMPSMISTRKPRVCCTRRSNAGQLPKACPTRSCSPTGGRERTVLGATERSRRRRRRAAPPTTVQPASQRLQAKPDATLSGALVV